MRWMLLAIAGCSSPDSGVGEIAISNSAAVLPASEAHGSASVEFSLDSRVCQSRTTFGQCVVRSGCTVDATRTFYSAGTVTIEHTTLDAFVPDANGRYGAVGVADGRISTPSSELTAHASGDQIAAFDLTLASPEAATVLAPARTTTDVARASDLAVTWSGVTTGSVIATVTDASTSIECVFAGPENSASIPSAALAAYSDASGLLTIASRTSVSTTLGAWTITFDVADDAAWSDGTTAALALTFH